MTATESFELLPCTPAPAWVGPAAWLIRLLPRGRYRLMDWLCRRPPAAFLWRLPAELGSSAFRCDLRDTVARQVCFAGRHEPQEMALVRQILRPGMTYLDVGANWGFFTLLAAHLVGKGGRVVSLEPHPQMFAILRENVARNELTQVTVLPFAAADRRGARTLIGFDEGGGNWGLSRLSGNPLSANSDRVFTVGTADIDHLSAELQLGTIDLLKLDVEGAEGLALAGMSDSLARRRVLRLLMELHPAELAEHGQSVEHVVGRLQAAGYRGWTVSHSPATNKWAYYAKRLDVSKLMRPFERGEPLDDWPHQLWLAPGVEL